MLLRTLLLNTLVILFLGYFCPALSESSDKHYIQSSFQALRAEKNGQITSRLELNSEVSVIGQSDGWSSVEIKGVVRRNAVGGRDKSDGSGRELFIATSEQMVWSKPYDGRVVARPERGVVVELVEDKGDWLQVSIKGWLPSSVLSKTTTTAEKALSFISVDGKKVTFIKKSETVPRSRAELELSVKNSSQRTIKSWEAILIGRNSSGKVLIRTKASNPDANTPPGGSGKITYYFDRGDRIYRTLFDYSLESISFELFKPDIIFAD